MNTWEKTVVRLDKWRKDLIQRLVKLENSRKDESIEKRKHIYAQIDKVKQKIDDLETAIQALKVYPTKVKAFFKG